MNWEPPPPSSSPKWFGRTGRGPREEVRALRGINLAIAPGELLSVAGPSGCGKTTLLNLLGLLDSPTSGEVRWNGEPVGQRTDRARARLRLEGVGFIFQRFYLLPTLTARENVELPMRALRVPRAERTRRALELIEEVGLTGRERAFPHQLSGGEEQRVAVARALANRPGLLLADEPTGELDSGNTQAILSLLERVRRDHEASLLLVTHNPEVARRAHRHITMRDGTVPGRRSGGLGTVARIAILLRDRCHPKECQWECQAYCPPVRMGQECIIEGPDTKPIISESLCIGCGICVHKCPFDAIKILNTPEANEAEIVHRVPGTTDSASTAYQFPRPEGSPDSSDRTEPVNRRRSGSSPGPTSPTWAITTTRPTGPRSSPTTEGPRSTPTSSGSPRGSFAAS